jgi:hypothetical protein
LYATLVDIIDSIGIKSLFDTGEAFNLLRVYLKTE